MSEQIDMTQVPPVPPEVEQAAMLGNTKDAVSLYMKFTGIDEDTAYAVVAHLAE
jgi:hypothetical protein